MSLKKETIHEAEMSSLLMEYLQHGVAYKDIQGISDDTMEELYAHAYHFYRQGKLDQAEEFFKLLCMYDLNNPDYFIGLGAVSQLKKKYQRACDLYSLAYVLGDNNLKPVLYSGQCQLFVGDIPKALRCFELVVEESTDDKLIRKAQVYIDTIKTKRTSTVTDDNEG
jgi:type III secretion low calcium response chaperone LcrH/SycD